MSDALFGVSQRVTRDLDEYAPSVTTTQVRNPQPPRCRARERASVRGVCPCCVAHVRVCLCSETLPSAYLTHACCAVSTVGRARLAHAYRYECAPLTLSYTLLAHRPLTLTTRSISQRRTYRCSVCPYLTYCSLFFRSWECATSSMRVCGTKRHKKLCVLRESLSSS